MNIIAFLIADPQPPKLEQPREDAFHDTTMDTQTTAVLSSSLGDEGCDAALPQRLADFRFGVVGRVGIDFVGTFSPSAAGLLDRRDGVDQGERLLRIVDVRAGVENRQRRPLAVTHNMPFRAIFAAIRGIGTRARPPKTAHTEQL